MNPEPHGIIGSYELVEYLTAGGMADLYLARSPGHDAPVVLKTIQRKYAEMTRVVKMFIDEGRIAKALDHPNVVRIFDVGESQGAYYIAMEFIVGRDLLAIARRGIEAGRFLPLHLAAAILAQVATGLVYAHEKHDADNLPLDIVHCDISPGNVVVSFGGTAKIVDFGIARAAIQLRAEDHTIAGKYNYMAPEQIRGEPLDARADLFSLGIILYELTVGRRLFRGQADDVKKRILSGVVPRPTEVRPDLPPALERIILRALEGDRARRYRSARELRSDLLDYIGADGHVAGKRELAEYLRSIFIAEHAAVATPATTTTAGTPAAVYEVTRTFIGGFGVTSASGDDVPRQDDPDEDLALEAPIPGLAQLLVDPDDPEPPPLAEATVAVSALAEITAPEGAALPVDEPAPTPIDDLPTTLTVMPEMRPRDADIAAEPTPRVTEEQPTTEHAEASPAPAKTQIKSTHRRRRTDHPPGKSPFAPHPASPAARPPLRGRRANDPEGPLHLSRPYAPTGHSELFYAAIAIVVAIGLYLLIRA